MNKVTEIILDFFIAIIVMFLFVMLYFGLRSETVTKVVGNEIAEHFLLEAKKNGDITVRDYENLIERLSLTGNLYDISLEHRYKVFEPEYRLRTIEEIIEAQNAAYTKPNIYDYVDISTNTPVISDPVVSGSLNTETNESVLASAVSSGAAPDHVHTAECYHHSHTEVYGSTDLSNVPVYATYQREVWATYHYIHTIYVRCAICDSLLYSIQIRDSDYLGTAMVYTYNANGIASNSIFSWNPSTLSNRTSVSNAFWDFYNYLFSNTSIEVARAENEYVTHDFYYSYEYYPSFISDGSANHIPFTGCTNLKAHPNQNACFPIGKIGKVNINAYQYYYYRQYFTLNISVTCADCGRELLRLNINKPDSGYTSYNEGINGYYYEYGSDSSIVQHSINAMHGFYGLSAGSHNYYDIQGFANLAYELYSHFYGVLTNNCTVVSTGSGNLSMTAGYIDWPFTSFPYALRYSDLSPIWWQPIRGCVYCGIYGSAYSCGGMGGDIICNQLVDSITPTHPTQTVYLGDPLITTVKATYADGSTKVVLATTDFQANSIIQSQTTTLTYTYTVAGTTYTKTCIISVTVIPRNNTCSNGHVYNLNTDGSDPGCPYCKAYVKSLRILSPNTSTVIITVGKSLQESGVKVLATYYDGHIETLTSEYVDNLDKDYYGVQEVTIGYKGVVLKVMVKTVCPQITCDICGYTYNLYPDGTNPGCPRCISRTPVFTGNVMEKEDTCYTSEILEELYEQGEYYLNQQDSLTMIINIKSTSLSRNLLRRVYPALPDTKLMFHQTTQIKVK